MIVSDAENINRWYGYKVFPVYKFSGESIYLINKLTIDSFYFEPLGFTLYKATARFALPFNNLFEKSLKYLLIKDAKNNIYQFDGFLDSYAISIFSSFCSEQQIDKDSTLWKLINCSFFTREYLNSFSKLLSTNSNHNSQERDVLTSNILLVISKGQKTFSLSNLRSIQPYSNDPAWRPPVLGSLPKQ
jgi:hypothetical protein